MKTLTKEEGVPEGEQKGVNWTVNNKGWMEREGEIREELDKRCAQCCTEEFKD